MRWAYTNCCEIKQKRKEGIGVPTVKHAKEVELMIYLIFLLIFPLKGTVAASRGHGGICPLSRRLCAPTCPQSEEKNGQNQPFSANCPLRIAFCPLDAPPQKKKKNSGAATGKGIC